MLLVRSAGAAHTPAPGVDVCFSSTLDTDRPVRAVDLTMRGAVSEIVGRPRAAAAAFDAWGPDNRCRPLTGVRGAGGLDGMLRHPSADPQPGSGYAEVR